MLGDYPTKGFLDDPETHIRWAMGYGEFETLADVALEFGYVLTRIPPR